MMFCTVLSRHAEINLANNAEAYARGEHTGWIPTCWEGIEMSVDIVNEKRIKVVINGGCLNPRGLAEKTHELVCEMSSQSRLE